jgi:tRNA (mo5U34)-methyltransferase
LDIDQLRRSRSKWLEWKNIAPLKEAVSSLPDFEVSSIRLGDIIEIHLDAITASDETKILETARLMKPWRKGPFRISKTLIDSEWQSFVKYNLIEPYFDLEGKIVGDIGCNNGYYLFRMLKSNPKKLVGFDPSALNYMQFLLINHFLKSDIVYEMLGVEHIALYEHRFDLLFCLGVLYHRSDPIATLKSLYQGLNGGGELILDTFMIDGDSEVALSPRKSYSKIPNVYFIPTIPALKNWCYRAGFERVEVLAVTRTDHNEQRKTEWIDTQSLEDFLDPNDANKTIEGYPAPKRVYIKAYKK